LFCFGVYFFDVLLCLIFLIGDRLFKSLCGRYANMGCYLFSLSAALEYVVREYLGRELNVFLPPLHADALVPNLTRFNEQLAAKAKGNVTGVQVPAAGTPSEAEEGPVEEDPDVFEPTSEELDDELAEDDSDATGAKTAADGSDQALLSEGCIRWLFLAVENNLQRPTAQMCRNPLPAALGMELGGRCLLDIITQAVSHENGLWADRSFQTGLRAMHDQLTFTAADEGEPSLVFLKGEVADFAKSIVTQNGARMILRAKAAALKLPVLESCLFFQFLQQRQVTPDDVYGTAMAAAVSAVTQHGVKSVRDLLFSNTMDSCSTFRAIPAVRSCLQKHAADLQTLVPSTGCTVADMSLLVNMLTHKFNSCAETLPPNSDPTLQSLLVAAATKMPGAVLAPAVQTPKIRHIHLQWAVLVRLYNAGRSVGLQTGTLGVVNQDDIKHKNSKTNKVRRRVLEALLPASVVSRIYKDKYEPVSVSTDGVTLNVKIAREAEAVRPGHRLPTLAGGLVSPPILARMSKEALDVLDNAPELAQLPFWALGKRVLQACPTADFSLLKSADRVVVGDLVLMSAGIDPFVTKRYKDMQLVFPLEANGNICPPEFFDSHIWLIASLRQFDPRFRFVECFNVYHLLSNPRFSFALDPGKQAPFTVTNAAALAYVVKRLRACQGQPHEPLRFFVDSVRTLSARAGTLHTVAVSAVELRAAVEREAIKVQVRACDKRFGPVVVMGHDLPFGLQLGDNLLTIDCDPLLNSEAAVDKLKETTDKLQVAVGIAQRPRVVGGSVRTPRSMVDVHFYRPEATTNGADQAAPSGVEQAAASGMPRAKTYVAKSLTKGEVKNALDLVRDDERALAEGRVLWASGVSEQKQAELAQLAATLPGDDDNGMPAIRDKISALRAALAAQEDLLAVIEAGKAIKPFMVAVAPTQADVFAALAVAIGIAPVVIQQFYRPSRIAAMLKRQRRTERLYDKAVHQTLEFIKDSVPRGAGVAEQGAKRYPVLLVGDWATKKKQGKHFAFQRYLDRLARRAIVIVVDEHCSTKLCSSCGSEVMYPDKHDDTKPHYGTVYCPNNQCPTQHRFLNRDVAAASNICNRFLAKFFVGGSLGMVLYFRQFCFFLVMLKLHEG
jgi:hypothetical protein